MGTGTELLEIPLEDMLSNRGGEAEAREPLPPPAPAPPTKVRRVYLIADQRNQAAAEAWDDLLFQSLEVISPLFDGDEREIARPTRKTSGPVTEWS